LEHLSLGFESNSIGDTLLVHANCFDWLDRCPPNTIHAVVTDPPYGIKEYERDQLEKRDQGSGGTWRIPPSFDGNVRAPLPRFTALTGKEMQVLQDYFCRWAEADRKSVV
jgi:site-specific DNA-methyltransferase (adenine-specific)